MPSHLNITALVHEKLRATLAHSSNAIDATAGNGHDAVFISQLLGNNGHLHLIDCQQSALDATRARLAQQKASPHTHYHLGNHALVLEELGRTLTGQIATCVFNLGYLPGGDKTITTTEPNTLRALVAADALLAPGGTLSIVCYPGHPEGSLEAAAVSTWAGSEESSGRYQIEVYQNSGTLRPSPYLLWLTKVPEEHTPSQSFS